MLSIEYEHCYKRFHVEESSMKRASLRYWVKFLLIGIFTVTSITSYARTRYVVREGKGYALCEQLGVHVNRVIKDDGHFFLTQEIQSFKGFKRPPFKEISLEETRELIQLIGEA